MHRKRWFRRLIAIALGLILGWMAAGYFAHVQAGW